MYDLGRLIGWNKSFLQAVAYIASTLQNGLKFASPEKSYKGVCTEDTEWKTVVHDIVR